MSYKSAAFTAEPCAHHKPDCLYYIEAAEIAEERYARGERQAQCPDCGRWFWPHEMGEKAVTNPRAPEYTAEQVEASVERIMRQMINGPLPDDDTYMVHVDAASFLNLRSDIQTVLSALSTAESEVKRLTLQVESAEAGFTDEELHALSLCAAWTDALSEGKGSDAVHRKPFAKIAMAGFRRVFGEGHHAKLCGRIDAARNRGRKS